MNNSLVWVGLVAGMLSSGCAELMGNLVGETLRHASIETDTQGNPIPHYRPSHRPGEYQYIDVAPQSDALDKKLARWHERSKPFVERCLQSTSEIAVRVLFAGGGRVRAVTLPRDTGNRHEVSACIKDQLRGIHAGTIGGDRYVAHFRYHARQDVSLRKRMRAFYIATRPLVAGCLSDARPIINSRLLFSIEGSVVGAVVKGDPAHGDRTQCLRAAVADVNVGAIGSKSRFVNFEYSYRTGNERVQEKVGEACAIEETVTVEESVSESSVICSPSDVTVNVDVFATVPNSTVPNSTVPSSESSQLTFTVEAD